jgi:O-antigen/teichoic acid export membrane protein
LVLLLAGIAYGPEVVGHLAAAFSIVVLAAVALFPALGHAILRHRNEHPVNMGLLRRTGGALLLGTGALGAIVLVDAATTHMLTRILLDPSWTAWVVVVTALTVGEQYALGLCSAAGVLDRYSAAMLASRIGLLVATCAVAALHGDPVLLLAAVAVASLFVVLQGLRALGRVPMGMSRPGLVRDGLAAAPNAWAWFLIAQGSLLVVQAGLGARDAGIFAIAYLLLNLPVLVLQGIAMAWMSRAARGGPSGEWQRTRLLVPWLLLAHVLVVAAMAVAGPTVWAALFGVGLVPAFDLLRTMAWGAPGFALAALLLPQWVARGWFLRLSALHMVFALAYLAGVWAAVRAGRLDLVGWCTAALGLGLAAAYFWVARRWSREDGSDRGQTASHPSP